MPPRSCTDDLDGRDAGASSASHCMGLSDTHPSLRHVEIPHRNECSPNHEGRRHGLKMPHKTTQKCGGNGQRDQIRIRQIGDNGIASAQGNEAEIDDWRGPSEVLEYGVVCNGPIFAINPAYKNSVKKCVQCAKKRDNRHSLTDIRPACAITSNIACYWFRSRSSGWRP